jgi:hypothetical protein
MAAEAFAGRRASSATTATGLPSGAQTDRRAVMPKDKNPFHEGENFTAKDLAEILFTKILSPTLLGNHKVRLTIAKVKKLESRSDNGGTELTAVLHFSECSHVRLPLDKTNLRELARLGDPAAWVGAVIEISTVKFFDGKPALRVKVLKAPATKPGPDSTPASTIKSHTKQ